MAKKNEENNEPVVEENTQPAIEENTQQVVEETVAIKKDVWGYLYNKKTSPAEVYFKDGNVLHLSANEKTKNRYLKSSIQGFGKFNQVIFKPEK